MLSRWEFFFKFADSEFKIFKIQYHLRFEHHQRFISSEIRISIWDLNMVRNSNTKISYSNIQFYVIYKRIFEYPIFRKAPTFTLNRFELGSWLEMWKVRLFSFKVELYIIKLANQLNFINNNSIYKEMTKNIKDQLTN